MRTNLLEAIVYYQDHQALMREVLDQMVEAAQPEPDDEPALRFATMVEVLGRDRDKAVTVAALAIMQLGDIRAVAAAGDPE